MSTRSRTRSNTTPPDTSTGSELRNYQLHQWLRQEELATVYAATHLTLDRPVEVHILRRTDWVSASRFQLAARLAARFAHPNLLSVISAGHDDQYGDYLVTPLLEAQPLEHILAQGPLPPLLALRVTSQVAQALDYLHAQQFIHRDVQPANILLSPEPENIVYLTNLSLAAGPGTPDLSSIDEADYLSPYSAPEQHLDPSESDPALDIYSLGAVLYHMLSGEIPPNPGEELLPLVAYDPSLEQVDHVLRRMMAVNPADRLSSAEECVGALRRALRHHIDQATDDMEESRWELVAEWLQNPLETVLDSALKEQTHEPLPDDPESAATVGAPGGFQTFLGRSRERADVLHRADTIRRILNRWSRQGFFRRPSLGQVIDLEQIVSYNIYFYELRTLYETRTRPVVRQRARQPGDHRATLAPPGLWEQDVPDTEPFADVRPQDIVLDNSVTLMTCTTCLGAGNVFCPECHGKGSIERMRTVHNPDNTRTQELISVACPTCESVGRVACETCGGEGNLVEEQVFTWSRRARLWKNNDDIEDLPTLALERHLTDVCSTSIDIYKGRWYSVAPLAELLQAAIDAVDDSETRIVATELLIRGVPMTEVDYQLNDKSQRLYLIGQDSELVGNWAILNTERIALVVIGVLVVVAAAGWGIWWLLTSM